MKINPEVQDSFNNQGVMRLIGAQMLKVQAGFCEIQLAFRPELSQQDGYFHGGVVSTIADSAGGYAAYSLMPENSRVLTVEFKINLIRPADGDAITARGRVIKAGKTLSVCDVDVFAHKHKQELLCARMQQTLICIMTNSTG